MRMNPKAYILSHRAWSFSTFERAVRACVRDFRKSTSVKVVKYERSDLIVIRNAERHMFCIRVHARTVSDFSAYDLRDLIKKKFTCSAIIEYRQRIFEGFNGERFEPGLVEVQAVYTVSVPLFRSINGRQ